MKSAQTSVAPGRAPSRWRSRRGIAILLTLGIMSLLLILAMGFLFNANTGKLVSSVNADAVRARMLADSGLQRFVSMIGRDFATISPMNPGVSFYASTTGDFAGRRYVATVSTGGDLVGSSDSALYAALAGQNFTPTSLSSDATLDGNVRWVNVSTTYDQTTAPGSTSKVIGRYCILGIDETGKIDPAAAMKDASTTEAADGDTGLSFSEIFISNAFNTTSPTADDFRTKATNAGGKVVWDSWRHLLGAGVGGLDPAEAYQAIFPHSRDIEAFADFSDTSIAKHRFNLRQSQAWWDAATVAALTTAASDFYAAGGGVGGNTGGIQWLSSGNADANHVAANLIDYSDSDDLITLVGAAPYAVTGNEKVPLANECVVVVEAPSAYALGVGVGSISVDVELVNLYESALPTVAGEVEVSIGYTWGTSTGTAVVSMNLNANDVPARSYKSGYVPAAATAISIAESDSVTAMTVDSVTIEVRKAAGQIWDYAFSNNGSTAYGFSSGQQREFSLEVNDPRLNHLSGQWNWGGWAASASSINTLDTTNSNLSFVGGDREVAPGASDTGLTISTAFIRNAPMESLWELGAIHRGGPWQTVNLTAYNGAVGTIGAYADGDASILDHVKMSDDEVVDGKFNANSKYELAWRAMLGHVKPGATYASPSSGAAAISTTGWSAGNGWYDAVRHDGAGAGDPSLGVMHTSDPTLDQNGGWFNRGQIATVSYFTDTELVGGSAHATDAAREELIGKLANHFSTRMNWFSVVVCAQALHPQTNSKILAESKLLAVVNRDAFTGAVRVEYVQSLED